MPSCLAYRSGSAEISQLEYHQAEK